MNKSLLAAVATAASLLAAGSAQAGDVHWSIGISLPPVATVISSAPAPIYAPAPVYAPAPIYAPAPVVVAPPPVVYSPPPVVYTPAPRVVYPAPVIVSRPVPVVYGPPHRHHGWGDRDRDGIPNRYDRYDNRDWRDHDRDGIPNWQDRYDNRRDYRDERKYRH